eukprot:CAMPEP_0116017488 /NCGR_PEP_ID=MMETSP0321-20121206/8077_1 /TAXON_ID=163516 /ORGANISM="Leptocylindrus danicus var. danicus, Strain B650" /LENGTH=387 /DNA_ID=CAMNT_0003487689 /DNA_START=128 /DNA_END=1291 /DNA_ORIENTATION=+
MAEEQPALLRQKDTAEGTINAALKDVSGLASKLKDLVDDHAVKHEGGKNDFDFLHVKNTLFISYMIDLVYYVQLRSKKSSSDDKDNESSIMACLNRLNEMRVILDKIRPMEKKLAYPLQKLLAAAENLANQDGLDHNDPLSFRPDMDALENDGNDDDNDDDEDSGSGSDDSDDDDDDLKAAKSAARSSSSKKGGSQKTGDNKASSIYKAPRLAAVHYDGDKESKVDKAEKEHQRQMARMRKTELLQTLRHQYGDHPEEDDMFGGAKLGTTKDAARRISEREAEKLAYEEKAMVRLPTTKKERKEKNRVMREEISNLGSLADLTDLSAGVKAFNRSNREFDNTVEGDYGGSKRRKSSGKKPKGPKNSLQSALYGMDGASSSSKKRKKR